MPKPFTGDYPITAGKYYSSGAKHIAYDYGCPLSTPILSIGHGVVGYVNDGVPNNPSGTNPGSGAPSNYIVVFTRHEGKDAYVYYQHLSRGLKVKKGDKVIPGQHIANSGNSGNSTGPHLHIATGKGHPTAVNRYQYMNTPYEIFPPSKLYVEEGSPDMPEFYGTYRTDDVILKANVDWKNLNFNKESSDSGNQHADGDYPTLLTIPCIFSAACSVGVQTKYPVADLKGAKVQFRIVEYNESDKSVSAYAPLDIALIENTMNESITVNGELGKAQRLRAQAKLVVPSGSPVAEVTLSSYYARIIYWPL